MYKWVSNQCTKNLNQRPNTGVFKPWTKAGRHVSQKPLLNELGFHTHSRRMNAQSQELGFRNHIMNNPQSPALNLWTVQCQYEYI